MFVSAESLTLECREESGVLTQALSPVPTFLHITGGHHSWNFSDATTKALGKSLKR
jgi:hypothetical protein